MTKYILFVIGFAGVFGGLFMFDAITDMVVWKDVFVYASGVVLAIVGWFAYSNASYTKPVKKQRNRY